MSEPIREYRVRDLLSAQARRSRALVLGVAVVLLLLAAWTVSFGGEQNFWVGGLMAVSALAQAIEPIYSWQRARRSRIVADARSLTLRGPGIHQRIEMADVRMARIHEDSVGKPRGLHLFPALDRDFELGPVDGLDTIVALVLACVPPERVLRVRW